MSFSMSNVKKYVKNNKPKYDTRSLFAYITRLDCVSPKVKNVLKTYLRYRLTIITASGLTVDKLDEMITELLENCCGKNIVEITPIDTEANYGEILYQLKYAIDKKFRYKIYHSEEKLSVDDLQFKEYEFKIQNVKTQEELDSFFEGVLFYD